MISASEIASSGRLTTSRTTGCGSTLSESETCDFAMVVAGKRTATNPPATTRRITLSMQPTMGAHSVEASRLNPRHGIEADRCPRRPVAQHPPTTPHDVGQLKQVGAAELKFYRANRQFASTAGEVAALIDHSYMY